MLIDNIDFCVRLKYPIILIFDSGVGGLSIYQELRRLLPNIYYLYFFDNEAFPYGNRSSFFILDRIISIFNKISERHKLDLAIIACNTVTVLLLEKLRSYFFFPIIGIIPNVQLGIQCTRNGIIGILATYRTINSKFILNFVNRFFMNYHILLLSASELVFMAEEKILHRRKVSISLLKDVLSPWLNILYQPDTIILGCTHFLHLEDELNFVFQKKIVLIGSPKRVAYHIFLFLKKHGINLSIFNVFKIKNKVYCSVITKEVLIGWSSILLDYNFSSLEEISI